MYKSIIAVAAAALIAGIATFPMLGAPADKAETPAAPLATDALATADRLAGPGMAAAACSQDAWPNYEPRCMVDARSAGDVRKVRVISLVRGETR